MRGTLRRKVVALDRTGKTFADRGSAHINHLTRLKNCHGNHIARLETVELFHINAEFFKNVAGFYTGLGMMSRYGFIYPTGTTFAKCHLHGGIAVDIRRLDLCDAIVRHIEHRNRNGSTVIGKDTRHADLASYKAQTHFVLQISGYDWPEPKQQLTATTTPKWGSRKFTAT